MWQIFETLSRLNTAAAAGSSRYVSKKADRCEVDNSGPTFPRIHCLISGYIASLRRTSDSNDCQRSLKAEKSAAVMRSTDSWSCSRVVISNEDGSFRLDNRAVSFDFEVLWPLSKVLGQLELLLVVTLVSVDGIR